MRCTLCVLLLLLALCICVSAQPALPATQASTDVSDSLPVIPRTCPVFGRFPKHSQLINTFNNNNNSVPSGPLYTIGQQVTLACSEGYAFPNSDPSDYSSIVTRVTTTCSASPDAGPPAWAIDLTTLRCRRIPCKPLELKDVNLRSSSLTGRNGDVSTYSCRRGFQLLGASTTRCSSAAWLPAAQPFCRVIGCPTPTAPHNGYVNITDQFTLPMRATYTCKLGYRLVGRKVATCTATSSQWLSNAPLCVSLGLKAHANQVGTYSAGSISLTNRHVIRGLTAAAQQNAGAIGFTVSTAGVARAAYLRASNDSLVSSDSHDTYVFLQDGRVHHYRGFTAPPSAILKPIKFARHPAILHGIQRAVRHAHQDNRRKAIIKLLKARIEKLQQQAGVGRRQRRRRNRKLMRRRRRRLPSLIQLSSHQLPTDTGSSQRKSSPFDFSAFFRSLRSSTYRYPLSSSRRSLSYVGRDRYIGFSVGRGTRFQVRLLAWKSLPLVQSDRFHTYTLPRLNKNIRQIGCFADSGKGTKPLRRKHVLPNNSKATRINCARAARQKAHQYFSLNGGVCYSGNQDYSRFGASSSCAGSSSNSSTPVSSTPAGSNRVFALASSLLNRGVYANRCKRVRATKLNVQESDILSAFQADTAKQCQVQCHRSTQCQQAVYDKEKKACVLSRQYRPALPKLNSLDLTQSLSFLSLMSSPSSGSPNPGFTSFICLTPRVLNGGFEAHSDIPFGKTSARISRAFSVKQWQIEGSAGVATYGSRYTGVNGVIPQGKSVLFLHPNSNATQTLVNLKAGRRYVLRFRENFRQDWRAGPTLRIAVGANVLYSNSITVPRWTHRTVSFIPESNTVQLTFSASNKQLLKPGKSAVLIDTVVIERPKSKAHIGRVGSASSGAHSVLMKINALSNPLVFKALQKVAQRTLGVIGFSVANNSVTLIPRDTFATSAESNAVIVLNNGTLLPNVRATLSAGVVSPYEKEVLRAVRVVARSLANSVGFSVKTGPKFHIRVLGYANLPLQVASEWSTYTFRLQAKDRGCWKAGNAAILTNQHTIRGRVSKSKCANLAKKNQHRYFALHNSQCYSGNNDYSSIGRSRHCSLKCPNGRDNCGGLKSANVWELPVYVPIREKRGKLTVQPQVSPKQLSNAQAIFGSSTSSIIYRSAHLPSDSPATSLGTIDFQLPDKRKSSVRMYALKAPTSLKARALAPSAWKLLGSQDGINYDILDSQQHQAFAVGQEQRFYLHHTTPYRYFRLDVSDNSGAPSSNRRFALSGFRLSTSASSVRSLVALYRFNHADAPGFDSSSNQQDLTVFGGNQAVAITQEPGSQRFGSGALRIHNLQGRANPAYLAIDAQQSPLRGLPIKSRSFTIAFWFYLNGSADSFPSTPMGVVGWGSSDASRSALNAVQLSADLSSVSNRFHRAGQGLNTPSTQPLTNTWTHFAVSYNRRIGSHKVYLNGTLVASRIYNNPKFDVAAQKFRIGLTSLGARYFDQFDGLLDDLAIFQGTLSSSAINLISSGNFVRYLPLDCRSLSARYNIEAGVSWGTATERAKQSFLRQKCNTQPPSCQLLSDQYGISTRNQGTADQFVIEQFKRLKCSTIPSLLSKYDTYSTCPAGNATVKSNVYSSSQARFICSQNPMLCRSYVWRTARVGSSRSRRHRVRRRSAASRRRNAQRRKQAAQQPQYLPQFTLVMCSVLPNATEARAVKAIGYESTIRVSPTILRRNTRARCAARVIPVQHNITSTLHARAACDAQVDPPCRSWIWTGPVGFNQNSGKFAPNRLIMCSDYDTVKSAVSYPQSGFVVGQRLRRYKVLSNRALICSQASTLNVVPEVSSSAQAQLLCDLSRAQGCVSYMWDSNTLSATLCANVGQTEPFSRAGVEVGFKLPNKNVCQFISNRFRTAYGRSWGIAPIQVRRVFYKQQCNTVPLTCQQLTDAYALSPSVVSSADSSVPVSLPSSIPRWSIDLYVAQQCSTAPVALPPAQASTTQSTSQSNTSSTGSSILSDNSENSISDSITPNSSQTS